MSDSRNNFDVTGCVNVTLTSDVCAAVSDIFAATYGKAPQYQLQIHQVFSDFDKLFHGSFDGYYPCDTLYHDIQHTLDMTLTMARLASGFVKNGEEQTELGPERFILGITIALFHDAGYIRKKDDNAVNGAVYTKNHVSRSGAFLFGYLPKLGMEEFAEAAATLVHYTGYEVSIEDIEPASEADRKLGHLLGTADLLAQLSDRCYLEKCRDRLFPEFVLGGLATTRESDADEGMYTSPEDLLIRTPAFFRGPVLERLNVQFERYYLLETTFFEGNSPYMSAINRNMEYLEYIIENGMLDALRRKPPVTTPA